MKILIILSVVCMNLISGLKITSDHYNHALRYYDTWEDFMRWFIRNYGSPELGRCNDHKVKEGESNYDWTKPAPFVGEYVGCGRPTGKFILRTENALIAAGDAVKLYYRASGPMLVGFM